jgi:hypothetical protein
LYELPDLLHLFWDLFWVSESWISCLLGLIDSLISDHLSLLLLFGPGTFLGLVSNSNVSCDAPAPFHSFIFDAESMWIYITSSWARISTHIVGPYLLQWFVFYSFLFAHVLLISRCLQSVSAAFFIGERVLSKSFSSMMVWACLGPRKSSQTSLFDDHVFALMCLLYLRWMDCVQSCWCASGWWNLGMRVDDGLRAVKLKLQGFPATTRHSTWWKSIREALYEKENDWQVTGRQVVRQKWWREWKSKNKQSPKVKCMSDHMKSHQLLLLDSEKNLAESIVENFDEKHESRPLVLTCSNVATTGFGHSETNQIQNWKLKQDHHSKDLVIKRSKNIDGTMNESQEHGNTTSK